MLSLLWIPGHSVGRLFREDLMLACTALLMRGCAGSSHVWHLSI